MGARAPRAAGFAVRRRAARPARGRWRPLLLGAALAAALAGTGWWLLHGSLFAVRRVETGAYRFTDRGALEARMSTLLGRNLWRVRGAEVDALLADMPWVRGVRVARRLPAALRLELEEWRPLVDVAGAGAAGLPAFLVADGRVLDFPEGLAAPALPVLVGVAAPPDSQGVRRLAADELPAVLALLEAVRATGLEAACPVDFVVARDDGFAIVLQEGRGTLLVGRDDFAARLDRYLLARDHLAPGLEVDLRFRDRVTVRRPDERS